MINKALTAIGKISLIVILAFVMLYGLLVILSGINNNDILIIIAGLFLLYVLASMIT